MNELDPTHQAVAEAARERIMNLINKVCLIAEEVCVLNEEDK